MGPRQLGPGQLGLGKSDPGANLDDFFSEFGVLEYWKFIQVSEHRLPYPESMMSNQIIRIIESAAGT